MNANKKPNDKYISNAVIRRLPRYFRYLREIIRQGTLRISSKELSAKMNLTASQIRQDLNCFGGFGQQGYGYNVNYLYSEISHILGVDCCFNAIIVGMGNLGHALCANHLFEKRGVTIKGLFDNNPEIVGTQSNSLTVMHTDAMCDFCRDNKIDIAILTLPKSEAFDTAKMLSSAGIKGFWNFSNAEISFPNYVIAVENVHLGDSLMALCYQLAKAREKENNAAENGSVSEKQV